MEELELKEGASVYFDQSTNLLIEKEFKGGKELLLSNEGHEVWIFTEKDVKIEESSEVTANIYTLKKLEVEKGANLATAMTGLFIAGDKVVAKENVFWNWSSFCYTATLAGGSNLVAPSNDSQIAIGSNLQPALEIASELTIAPNPFASATTIRFFLPKKAKATLAIFDLQGKLLQQLHNGILDAGKHQRQWNGTGKGGVHLPSGMYLIQLKIEEEVINKKVLLQHD